jgi:hypothetical protein
MRYDDCGIYSYSEEFSDLDIAVERIDHILTKIESELHGKDYVVDDVLSMISEFRDRLILNHSTDIFVSIGGNQEGTGMRFYQIPNTYRVKFECSDDESEMLKNGLKSYTDETISIAVKCALLDLCSESTLVNEEDS